MYFEKVSDFEPKSGNFDGSGDYVWNAAKQGYLQISNVLKTSFYNFENFSSNYSTSQDAYFAKNVVPKKVYLSLTIVAEDETSSINTVAYKFSTIKILKAIDQKMDNGKYNKGSIRSYCGITAFNGRSKSYNEVIEKLESKA